MVSLLKKLMPFVLLCFAVTTFGQETGEKALKPRKQSLYLGPQASTNGWGVIGRYAFTRHFSVRSGYETLDLAFDFDFDESDISYRANLNYQTGGFFLLADLNYTKNLYLSGGVIFNSFNPQVTGRALSGLEYGDIIIQPETIGTFSFSIEPKLKASPYAAAGFQIFPGKRDRMMFQFETGFYYMGPPQFKIEATGLLAPTADPALGQAEYLNSQFDAYKIYPVIKFALAVKLF